MKSDSSFSFMEDTTMVHNHDPQQDTEIVCTVMVNDHLDHEASNGYWKCLNIALA